MDPRQLLETQLDVIERAIRRVCHDVRIGGPDAEDFASAAKLALLADDGAILRKYEGRASFATYITIVARRLFIDQRRAEGRWQPAAAARRRGEHAVLLDRLLHGERRTFDEAAAIVTSHHPEVQARELREIAAALPERALRPHLVPIDDDDERHFAGGSPADERVMEHDLETRSASISRVMAAALAAMAAQDRLVLRLRFAKNSSIADIARALGLEQRPLYRRIEALLGELRRALQQAGLDAGSVTDLIGSAGTLLDFGLRRDETTRESTP
ncbi:MAG TPA: sigma-70 family RNA polymerase sigma factor [Thermoanaerobaculia bacterium]|jgi:RNA polymerase sigma factor for flagellar operon FliA|nr:sigma-70 family RNA polymerase sigma factor [Thermoanaerobaculia bacterium]